MFKKCGRCKKRKKIEKFSFRSKAKGTYISWCKDCVKKYDKKRYDNLTEEEIKARKKIRRGQLQKNRDRNRIYIWNYLKEHPCVDCPESDPVVLEFDHIEKRY